MNCPNCGADFDWRLQVTVMGDCPSCGTTVFRDGEALRAAGERGVMAEAPSLLAIGTPSAIDGVEWTPAGLARFSYGPGWWDEFWCVGADGAMAWISVDEGDVAIERPIDPERELFGSPAGASLPGTNGPVSVGDQVIFDSQICTATEVERAECVAIRGELPEILVLGETHDYVDFTGQRGAIVTLERWDDGQQWFAGRWVDPWTVRTGGPDGR